MLVTDMSLVLVQPFQDQNQVVPSMTLPRARWDRDYWTPDRRWEGKTVFVVGGGPSLKELNPEVLLGQHIIVVNSAAKLVPWAEILLFLDQGWYDTHTQIVNQWQGLLVTTSIGAKRLSPFRLKRLQAVLSEDFSSVSPSKVRMAPSGGHVAISLAIAMGASTIVLLGMDMRIVDGQSHFHNEYKVRDPRIYADRFIKGFAGWNEQAKAVGTQVFNATPGSALEEFPKIDLYQFLGVIPSATFGTHPEGDKGD